MAETFDPLAEMTAAELAAATTPCRACGGRGAVVRGCDGQLRVRLAHVSICALRRRALSTVNGPPRVTQGDDREGDPDGGDGG